MEDDEALDPITGLPIVPAVPPAPAPGAPPVPPAAPPAPAPPAPAAPTAAQRRTAEEATAADIRKREKNKLLREEYGTDDPDKIAEIKADRQKKLDEHTQLKSKEEEAARSQLSEVQRLTEDIQKLTTENEQLKAKLKNLEIDQVTSKQDAKIRSIAIQVIKPSKLKYAIIDFGEYIRSLTKVDAAKIDELRTLNWFKKFARDNTDMALEAAPSTPAVAATPPDDGTPPPVTRPTRVVPAGRPKPPVPSQVKTVTPDPLAGKTPKPGLPNSMNRQELAEHMKRQGLRPL